MSVNGRYRASSLPDSSKYSTKEYKDDDGYTRLTSAVRRSYRETNPFRTRNMREGKTEYQGDVDEIFLNNDNEEQHLERIRTIRRAEIKESDSVASKHNQQPGPLKITDISARLAESARIAARHVGSLASMAWPELASLPPHENGSRAISPRGSGTLRSLHESKAEAPPTIQPGGRLRDETWTIPLAPRSASPVAMNERCQDSFSSDSRSYQSVSPYSSSSRKLHSPRSETHERSADKSVGAKASLENQDWSSSSRNDRSGPFKVSVAPKLVSPRSKMFPLQSLSSVQEESPKKLRERNDTNSENTMQAQEEKGEDPFASNEARINNSRRQTKSNKWNGFTPPPRRRFSTSDDGLGSAYDEEEEFVDQQNEARRVLARDQAEHELLEYGTDRTFVEDDNELIDERKSSPGQYFASRMEPAHLTWSNTEGGIANPTSNILRLECKMGDFTSRMIKLRNVSDLTSAMIDIAPSSKSGEDSATLFVFPSNFTMRPGATQQVELVLYGAASPREEVIVLKVSNLTTGINQRFRLLARTNAASNTSSPLDKHIRSPHQKYAIVTADCRMIDFGHRVSVLSGDSTQFRLKNQSEVEPIFVTLSVRNANKAHVFHVRFRGGAHERKIEPGCDAIVILTLLPGPSDPPGCQYTCLVGIEAEAERTQIKHKFSIPAKGSCFIRETGLHSEEKY